MGDPAEKIRRAIDIIQSEVCDIEMRNPMDISEDGSRHLRELAVRMLSLAADRDVAVDNWRKNHE